MKLMKVDWMALEREIRSALRDSDFAPGDALRCIDEALARHTRRGNAMPEMSEPERQRLENQYPTFFDWNE